jgi:hypothetical protein
MINAEQLEAEVTHDETIELPVTLNLYEWSLIIWAIQAAGLTQPQVFQRRLAVLLDQLIHQVPQQPESRKLTLQGWPFFKKS